MSLGVSILEMGVFSYVMLLDIFDPRAVGRHDSSSKEKTKWKI